MESVATVQPVEEKASRWEDFIDIYIAPAALFARRATESAKVPLISLAVITLALYYVLLPLMAPLHQAGLAQAIAQNPEAAEQIQSFGNRMRLIQGIFVPLFVAAFTLLIAAVTLLAAKIFSLPLSFRQAFMITAWTGFVGIPQQIAIGISAFLKDRSGAALDLARDTSFGPLRFMNPETINDVLMPLIRRFDLFALWGLVIMAIALKVVARSEGSQAWGAAALVWISYALPMVIWAAVKG